MSSKIIIASLVLLLVPAVHAITAEALVYGQSVEMEEANAWAFVDSYYPDWETDLIAKETAIGDLASVEIAFAVAMAGEPQGSFNWAIEQGELDGIFSVIRQMNADGQDVPGFDSEYKIPMLPNARTIPHPARTVYR